MILFKMNCLKMMRHKKKLQQFGGTVVAEKGHIFKSKSINGFSLHKWFVQGVHSFAVHLAASFVLA